jgi:DNA polymerase-3 subunit epsilon/ATP-dependent DNA helicase DinG
VASRPREPGETGDAFTASFVAIDLETTGFDPDTDRIIDVGATRFDRAGRAESFESLVDPGRPIPAEIHELTGIGDADVTGAPTAPGVLEELRAFCGGLPVVGQSVGFDLSFLRAAGLELPGEVHDTHHLAAVLLPTNPRLSLAALVEELGVANTRPHRALADAEATRDVFLRLLDGLAVLPRTLLLDLAHFAARGGWSAQRLFDEAADAAPDPVLDADAARVLASAGASRDARPVDAPPPLEPREGWQPLDAGELERLFALAGSEPGLLPGYQQRDGQQQMSEAVREAFEGGGRLLVESGTGTGKSLAYLLPALAHARRSGERVAISTHTLNLQEQLAARELPRAAALIERAVEVGALPGDPPPDERTRVEAAPGRDAEAEAEPLRWAVLKGRSNYLCHERWAEARAASTPLDVVEARLLARVASWLPESESGDVAELPMRRGEPRAWRLLSAEGVDCLSRRCVYVRDGSCFLLRARQRAHAAHAVVVNHALLLASAATGEQALPPFRHLVIDEAHRLEEVATQQYGARLALSELADLLEPRGARGLAEPLERAVRPPGEAPLAAGAPLEGVARELRRACAAAATLLTPLGEALAAFLAAFAEPAGAGSSAELVAALSPARRGQRPWEDVEVAALDLDVALGGVSRHLEEALLAVESLPPEALPEQEGMRLSLARSAEALAERRETLARTALSDEPGAVVWVAAPEQSGAARPRQARLQLAPLDVGEALARDLYDGREAIIATSATLAAPVAPPRVSRRRGAAAADAQLAAALDAQVDAASDAGGDAFSFSARRLGLAEPWQEDLRTLAIPSPFDYRRAVLMLQVRGMPEPQSSAYEEQAWRVLADATEAAGGRSLALFTSHAALRAASASLRPALASRGIAVLAQGVDGTPAQLLRQLRERPRTLVLGTAALWEGVDVRGDALQLLAMARLPFPVPTDPVHSGRARGYDDPFGGYSLPQAVLRFRQGFGRLIRGPGERGVFLMLDGRLATRSYGAAFLDALPDCERRELPVEAIAPAVAGWLRR